MSFNVAKGMVIKVAGKHYPAPLTAVTTIEKAANCARNEALQHETAAFIPLAHSTVAQALVSIFLNDQYIKTLNKKYTQQESPPNKVMVLGAGIMGGGDCLSISQQRRFCADERYKRSFSTTWNTRSRKVA